MSTRDNDFFGFGSGDGTGGDGSDGRDGDHGGGGSAVPDSVLRGDNRTLRLSAPGVNPEKVDAFLVYQRAFVARTELSLADAHVAALQESGLDPNTQAQLNAVALAFCGRITTTRKLRERMTALEQGTEEERELAAKAAKELARLEDLSDLGRRYGEEAIACLGAREEALVAAHHAVYERVRRA